QIPSLVLTKTLQLETPKPPAMNLRLQTATQTKCGCGGHRHFQKFSNQERIQTEKCSALPTVRHCRQPTEASGEQDHLGNRTGHHVAHKSKLPALRDPSCHEGDNRVRPQVTCRRTEQ